MSDNEALRYITVAIHTYDKAIALRSLLESEGMDVVLQNVNLEHPAVSPGIRVRIPERDLPLALRIIENRDIFIAPDPHPAAEKSHYVLVPVDLSERSVETVRCAAAIASRQHAAITLLHSYIDPYVSGEGVQLTDALTYDILDADARRQIENSAKKAMEAFAAKLRAMMKEGSIAAVRFDTVVVEGVPEDAVYTYTRNHPPLVTVMSTRDADRKEREMIGSVAAEVLDAARTPVLTLPQTVTEANIHRMDNILFFCNADQDDILAMDTLRRLLPDRDASVTLAVVPSRRRWLEKSRPQSAVNALIDYFRHNYSRYTFNCVNADCLSGVDDISALHSANDFDLIVVPKKKKLNVLSRIFHPSLTHRLIFKADVPMLVIPV